MPDIVIGGVGVLKDHCRINFDGTTVTLIPNSEPNTAKVFVNGKLVIDETPLMHNDRILFGTHNYFVLNDPSQIESSDIDWELANKEVIQDQLNAITSDQDELLQKKMKEMEEKFEAERKKAEEEAKNRMEEHIKNMEEKKLAMEKEYQDKIGELKKLGGREGEVKKLQDEMNQKKAEGDKEMKEAEETLQRQTDSELKKQKRLKEQ